MVEPLLLFPIDLDGPNKSPHLDLSYPTTNQKALQSFVSADREALMEELVQLEHELGLDEKDQLIEPDELALRLQSIRPEWPWEEKINPDELNHKSELAQTKEAGIFNRAVVVMTERSPFTQGLEVELCKLAQFPADKYSSTALEMWLTGSIDNSTPTLLTDELVEVVPINLEQRQAIESANR